MQLSERALAPSRSRESVPRFELFSIEREREERWKIQREAHLEQEAATSSAAPWVKRLEKAHSRALALLFSKLPRRRCFGAPPFHDVTAGIG